MTREDIEKAAQSRCDRRFSYLHNNAFLTVLFPVQNGASTPCGMM